MTTQQRAVVLSRMDLGEDNGRPQYIGQINSPDGDGSTRHTFIQNDPDGRFHEYSMWKDADGDVRVSIVESEETHGTLKYPGKDGEVEVDVGRGADLNAGRDDQGASKTWGDVNLGVSAGGSAVYGDAKRTDLDIYPDGGHEFREEQTSIFGAKAGGSAGTGGLQGGIGVSGPSVGYKRGIVGALQMDEEGNFYQPQASVGYGLDSGVGAEAGIGKKDDGTVGFKAGVSVGVGANVSPGVGSRSLDLGNGTLAKETRLAELQDQEAELRGDLNKATNGWQRHMPWTEDPTNIHDQLNRNELEQLRLQRELQQENAQPNPGPPPATPLGAVGEIPANRPSHR